MVPLDKKESIAHEVLPLVVRTAPLKKMKRLRVTWFVLGVIAGGMITHFAASLFHGNQEYSKLQTKVTYAQVDYQELAIRALTVPVPAMSTPVPAGHNAVAAVQPEQKPEAVLPRSFNVAVRRGDTLMSVLMDRGISYDEAYKIVHSMKRVYNPKHLSAGQSLELRFDKSKTDSSKPTVAGLSIAVSPLKTVSLARAANNSFVIKEIKALQYKSLARAGGTITSSLYQTGVNSGIPPQMLAEIISAFSYDVDFQRDIREGDIIDVVYERLHTDKGVTTGVGKVVYASLDLGGEKLAIYRHTSSDGYSGYYNYKGESVKKALLKTPINGSHITSGFGMRMHPLLGYSKMHKGIDFGAATGTPIYAAGDGVVAEAGRKGGYGNYVRINHNNRYATAYGHASRIARGIRTGAHVKQGQVIAYVGSTGQSTGPHLHYEILVGGTQVNPSGVKFRTGQMLQGHELAQFKQQVKQVGVTLATMPRKTLVALK